GRRAASSGHNLVGPGRAPPWPASSWKQPGGICQVYGCSIRTSNTFIHEGERIPSSHISGVEPLDEKSRRCDQIVDLAVEVAAAAEAFPARRQAMLPPRDPMIGREPMLDEEQATLRPKDTSHLAQRRDDLRDRAQRPGRHDRVE